MPNSEKTRRNVRLLEMTQPLRDHADSIEPDINAAAMLVHQTLTDAFHEPPDLRSNAALEASLKDDIDRHFAEDDSDNELIAPPSTVVD